MEKSRIMFYETISAKIYAFADMVRGGHMKKEELEKSLKTEKVMSRQDICNIARSVDDTFRDTLLRNLIEELMSSGTITRIGRNCYIKMSETQNHKKFIAVCIQNVRRN
ncbi:MAG: hypothetical protein LIO99_09580 [Clostridiales bacterium]|nr:hypothetical protein [Clostridiales bacterium]